jgi:hypothetical protein
MARAWLRHDSDRQVPGVLFWYRWNKRPVIRKLAVALKIKPLIAPIGMGPT